MVSEAECGKITLFGMKREIHMRDKRRRSMYGGYQCKVNI
jgi:hypothetical protein